MADINNCVIVGNITRDFELKKTQNGASVVNFTIANNRDKEHVSYIDVQCWNKTAEMVCQYLRKGSKVGVVGRWETRTYQNQQGQNVKVNELAVSNVQFLESRQRDENVQTSNYSQQTRNCQPQGNGAFTQELSEDTLDIASDDLPF